MSGPTSRRRRPRQADIAELAGVSQATVSMVINGRDGKYNKIGEDTRRRVWDAVEQLGYAPNPAARILAGGRASVLGVYTFEPVFPVDHQDFYHPFLLGMEEEAERLRYDLLLFTSASGPDRQRQLYRDGHNRLGVADGCVMLGRDGDRTELGRLLQESFPIVFVGRRELESGQVAYVGADYVTATRRIVDHLLGLGHRQIALLAWPDTFEATVDRIAGFVQAVEASVLPTEACPIHRVDAPDVDALLLGRLLDGGTTAVIAQDEPIAGAVVDLAEQRGMRVPDDLSVAVLGDSPRRPRPGHNWTSFDIPRRQMGARALAVLVDMIESEPAHVTQELLGCPLRPGATTAAPSA